MTEILPSNEKIPQVEVAGHLTLLINKIDNAMQISTAANQSLDSTKELGLWPDSLSNRSMSVLASGLFNSMNNYRLLYIKGIKNTQNVKLSPIVNNYLTSPHAFNVDQNPLKPAFHSATCDFTELNKDLNLIHSYDFSKNNFPVVQGNLGLRRQTFNVVMPSAELLHSIAHPTSSLETTKQLFKDLRELVMALSVDLYGKTGDTNLTNEFIIKHGKKALLESLPLIHPYITDALSLLNSRYAYGNLMDTHETLKNIVISFSNVLYYLDLTLAYPIES